MKKIIIVLILLVVTSSTIYAQSFGTTFKGYPVVQVKLDGVELKSEAPGINLEGTTLVPLRAIAENLNLDVSWDQESSTVALQTKPSPDASSIRGSTAEKNVIVRLYKFGNMIKDLHAKLSRISDYSDTQAKNILREADTEWYKRIDQEGLTVSALFEKVNHQESQEIENLNTYVEIYSELNKAYQQMKSAAELYNHYLSDGSLKSKDVFYSYMNTSFDTLAQQIDLCLERYIQYNSPKNNDL